MIIQKSPTTITNRKNKLTTVAAARDMDFTPFLFFHLEESRRTVMSLDLLYTGSKRYARTAP